MPAAGEWSEPVRACASRVQRSSLTSASCRLAHENGARRAAEAAQAQALAALAPALAGGSGAADEPQHLVGEHSC